MPTMLHFLLITALAFVLTLAFVPVIRRIAIARGIVDQPGPRRVNKKPIPRLGGVAMFFAFILTLLVELILELVGVWTGPLWSVAGPNIRIIGVVIATLFIVLVGIYDDIHSLRPGVKFLGQFIASAIIAFSGTLFLRFQLPFSGDILYFGPWAYPITIIYLVCFINIINLIDGLDGLAAGIVGIACIALFVMMLTLGRPDAALIAILLVALCAGFLVYNFNPASIFMGDSGSMMLGLLLGSVSLLGAARFSSVTIMIVPIIVALVPIIDTLGAIVRRSREHKPIQEPDSEHIHHRLLRRGFSQRKAVLFIYLWTALLSIGAVMMWELGGIVKYAVFGVLVLASLAVVWHLGLFGPIRQRHGRRDIVYDTEGIDPDSEGTDTPEQ